MTKIMQLSDFEGNRAYAKTHADDDSVEGLTKFVNNLIKGTSTNIDLTDYLTKEEIKQLLSDSIKNSLKDYYTKEEVKELMATGTDLSDYYTKEQIDSIIDEIPKADLSNYYTKADVDELIKQISSVDFSNYSTTEEMKKAITDAIAAYKPDMSNYYDKADIDNKISEVDNKISGIKVPDTSQYLSKDEASSIVNTAVQKALQNSNLPVIRTQTFTKLLNGNEGYLQFTKIDNLIQVFGVINQLKINRDILDLPNWAIPKDGEYAQIPGFSSDSDMGSHYIRNDIVTIQIEKERKVLTYVGGSNDGYDTVWYFNGGYAL